MNLEEKNVELKIANWTFKIGEIAELKILNGKNIAWIAELKMQSIFGLKIRNHWLQNNIIKISLLKYLFQ